MKGQEFLHSVFSVCTMWIDTDGLLVSKKTKGIKKTQYGQKNKGNGGALKK